MLTQKTDPEKEVQRILDGAKRKGFLSPRQVNGQVVELLSLGHHLPTAASGGGKKKKKSNGFFTRMSQRRVLRMSAAGQEAGWPLTLCTVSCAEPRTPC